MEIKTPGVDGKAPKAPKAADAAVHKTPPAEEPTQQKGWVLKSDGYHFLGW